MDDRHLASADRQRLRIERGPHDAAELRAALSSVPPALRDAWLDRVFGLEELPDDGPELPRGCVPYMPSSVDVLLRLIDEAPVTASDVFVDVGAGVGRAGALVHLLTGAEVIALEIQPHLVAAARDLATRLRLSGIHCVAGDAANLAGGIPIGSVFFLYCPFGGDRLTKVLADLEILSRARALRICCLDLPLPPCAWLTRDPPRAPGLAIYRSAGVVARRPRAML